MHQPPDLLHQCLELLHDGRVIQADGLAREGLKHAPDDGALWQLLGLMRRERGDFEGAMAALETASVLIPLNSAARCALADCYARACKGNLARDLYRLLAADADCPTALLPAVASGLGSVGDDATALEVCRELSRREPERHEALVGMAFYMRRLGHPATSIIPVVSRAHDLAPRFAPYRVLLGTLMAHVGRHSEATDLLREVQPESIHCPCCLRRMMAIFRLAGDHALCDACRRQADHVGRTADDARDH